MRLSRNEVNAQLGYQIAYNEGFGGKEWLCLDELWGRNESGWDNTRHNPYSSAYGIAQFLDGTWAGTGYKKTSDPVIQIKAGLVYIQHRYSTPCNALQFSINNGWY